ncbi:amidohydrolase family protein [Pontibacillus yanchengensis]|uniref:Amidohydrolase family protein n=1 Tax=Pontibacillus yanchengensis TaxID=462910 RepID=A0A6I5A044_9BACI|nr:amidohydrolase [Pontibacillus yanchengensis]MYL34107.1 amidohydrolase family protein [Pontibacillus yanchengensis]
MGELWFGGTIYTMNVPEDNVDAIYVHKGTIMDTGAVDELRNQYKEDIEQEHNLQGHVMYPGFVDSHLHIINHGEKLLRLNLAYFKSPEEVKDALRTQIPHLEEGEWMIGEGWNENQWEDTQIIHKAELDEISTIHPIMLTRVCRHALIANSKAMELAGVTSETADPQGGKIIRDENGITGYFLDTAQDIIKQAMPPHSKQYLKKAIKSAVEDLMKNGIVGGHSEDLAYYGDFHKTYHAFLETIQNDFPFHAHLLVHHHVVDDMQLVKEQADNPYVEFGAMKVFSDGAIGGRTAWLSADYSDESGNKGMPIHTDEDLSALVRKAREYNMPVAIHAIGDAAVEAVIEVMEEHPANRANIPDRIIHAQIMRDDLYERLRSLHAIVDIQPTFVGSDFPWVIERLGEGRLANAYPWKKLLQHEIPCAGGSDAPIEEINPLLGIQAAVLRQSYHDHESYGDEQKLTMFEAISLYTTGSAYAIGKEKEKGKILPGYNADFTVLDRDLFSMTPENLLQVVVSKTIIAGRVVYDGFA